VHILALKGEKMGVFSSVRREEIRRVTSQIENLCRMCLPAQPGLFNEEGSNHPSSEMLLSVHDSRESILRAMEQLGYILSAEDQEKVYQAFLGIAEKKERISLKELDALIAAEAMQVPPAYQVSSFVVNSGNDIGAMAHMKLAFHGRVLDGISSGDGIIDAAFLALEKATGRHFELDEFQIQAITEGREAAGEAIVKLRSMGKLYSGRGISTDIVGASIMAYVNALNKIVYEEEAE
jgi:2-isopropylmalate synthase